MSGAFRNIDPPLTARRHTRMGGGGGGGSKVRKTPDTALYSIYVSTLWAGHSRILLEHETTRWGEGRRWMRNTE
jgi:hypothetical protein